MSSLREELIARIDKYLSKACVSHHVRDVFVQLKYFLETDIGSDNLLQEFKLLYGLKGDRLTKQAVLIESKFYAAYSPAQAMEEALQLNEAFAHGDKAFLLGAEMKARIEAAMEAEAWAEGWGRPSLTDEGRADMKVGYEDEFDSSMPIKDVVDLINYTEINDEFY